MNKRLLAYTLLGLLIVSGLTVGLFRNSLQQALTQPSDTMGQQRQTHPAQSSGPTATPQPQQSQNIAQASVLASDTFQRTDQTLWGQASDGRQWQGDANAKASFAIVKKAGEIAQGNGGLNAVLGAAQRDIDVTITGSVNAFGNGVNMGILLRWSDANNWYKAHIDGTHLSILRTVNGQGATIGSMNLQTLANTVYKLRFEAVGAMLFAKVWPAASSEPANWQLTVSDTSLTSGQAGIRVIEGQTTVITVLSFEVVPATMGGDEV
jgi:hypothetical protein